MTSRVKHVSSATDGLFHLPLDHICDDFSGSYAAIQRGVDLQALAKRVPILDLSKLDPDAGTLALAYVSTVATAPSAGGTCQQIAAVGDIKVGIVIVTDTSCATGGIGCISDVCRYCRLVYTQQSAAFTDCGMILGTDAPTDTPVVTPIDTEARTAAPTKSPADQPVCTQVVGVSIVTDASCANGGLGCIDTVCRFCKTLDTAQPTTYTDCIIVTDRLQMHCLSEAKLWEWYTLHSLRRSVIQKHEVELLKGREVDIHCYSAFSDRPLRYGILSRA
ncbi:hypothetical protein GQ600_12616 [Phytophthora cactorum]|nr:hypothetical protein GQ600_12616 [Phytophthora cactorum]